jgi:hypothetical protein
MKHFTSLLLATVCALTFAGIAGAAGTRGAERSSIIYLGKPLDCKVDICPKVEEAKAPTPAKLEKPLVDAYGMPTNMPTLIRGSETSPEVSVSMPRKVKPAAAPAATETSADAKPAQEKESGGDAAPKKLVAE